MPLIPFVSVTVFIKFLILTLLLIEIILKKRNFINYNQYIYLILFVLIIFFSTLFADDLHLSFQYIWLLFHFLLLLFLITQIIDTKYLLKSVILILIFNGLLLSLIGVWQYLFDSIERVKSVFLDPNILSSFLVFLIPLNFYLIKLYKNIKKILLLSILILMILVSILTLSRSGLITLFLVLFLISLKEKKISFFFFFIFLLFIGFLLAPLNIWSRVGVSINENHVTKLDLMKHTFEPRAQLLITGFKMFLDNFLVGVGIGNFGVNFSKYFPYPPSYHIGVERVAHNIYLGIAAELGIFGLAFFFLFIWNLFKILHFSKTRFSKDKELLYIANGLYISLVGVLITGLFLNIEWSLQLWLLFSIILSLNYLKSKNENTSYY